MSLSDRLPPSSSEAEQGVLGCILIDPAVCLPQCVSAGVSGESFYDMRNQIVFDALCEMQDSGKAIDVITLQQWLRDRGALDKVGGIAGLMELSGTVPSAGNLPFYVKILREKEMVRRLIRTCSQLVNDAYESEGDVEQLIARAESEVLAINQDSTIKDIRKLGDGIGEAISTIESWWQNQGKAIGIPTGFPDLDKLTKGFRKGDMVVIAARPSVGKSSFGMNIVEHAAMEGVPIGVFSVEMTYESLILRALSSSARVNLQSAQEGFLSERDFPKLTNAAGRLKKAPVWIDDSSDLTIHKIRARARRMVQQHGVEMFLVDYLGLIRPKSVKGKTREQEVAEISFGLKSMAKELKVPVVVLAQLNRELEKDKKRKPRLSDLRESGSVEQDADVVGFLYNPQAEDEEGLDYDPNVQRVDLLIAKQRNGPTGNINLTFLKQFTRFESMSRVTIDDSSP